MPVNLGVATLGFSIDAAISKLHLEVAVVLIVATALLTALVDALSRALRLTDLPTRLSRSLPGSRVSKGLQPSGGVRGRSP
ncbi:hypothetical protein MKK84_31130 [Methylobacterium sp. E-065]|uniref:hypothetical protein n=1 Tax=Methylobacterium sp. E-065 TaxID=2836583 RepID=UPI001FBA394F|nr:hypothetical protein [Methylobacterium sp. E-065]MCJ2021815.1 hypothetical protein [Methylobacterium sp. E-065]